MLGFAGVLVRTSTERPEVLDKGSVVIGGIKGDDVEQAMELAVAMRDNREPVVMAEDLGLPEGEQRRLREIHSLLVPEYADYFELTHTGEGESCFVDSIRYQCRWEWTAELLYRLLRWECEAEGVSALHRGGTALLDAELGFDAACTTADGSYVLLRQGDVVALVGCDGMDMTAPERLEMLWGRLDLKEETT